MLETIREWDKELLIYLNNLGSQPFDNFWVFVTQIESWIPLFVVLVFLIFYKHKNPKAGVWVFLFVLITFWATYLTSTIVKEIVARVRPCNLESLTASIRVLQTPTDFSFFSGHASSSFSITTFVVLVLRRFGRWIYVLYLWPFLFAYSRIYAGAHFPTDIFVGALIGTLFGYIGYLFCKRFLERKDLV